MLESRIEFRAFDLESNTIYLDLSQCSIHSGRASHKVMSPVTDKGMRKILPQQNENMSYFSLNVVYLHVNINYITG